MKTPSYGNAILGIVREMNDEIDKILSEERETKMEEILQILNLRLVYEPHWVGIKDGKVTYDHFEITACHEIEARYLPEELHKQLWEFIEKVEQARDRMSQ